MSVIEAYRNTGDAGQHAAFLTLFTAAAAGISIAESLIPVPFWKPGLGNIVVLLLLVFDRKKDAVIVGISRTFVAAFFKGGIFGPGHILSVGGAVASLIIMMLLAAWKKNSISGISAAGAFFHSAAQLGIASLFLVSLDAIVFVAPLFLGISIVSGLLTGWVACVILQRNGYVYEKSTG